MWRSAGGIRNRAAVYLLGNKLVLKCWAADYDVAFGNDDGYGFGWRLSTSMMPGIRRSARVYDLVSVEGVGDSMYIGTVEDVPSGTEPECAYLLQELNVNTLEMARR